LVRGACACFCLRPVLAHPGIPAISFGDGPYSEYSRLSCLIQSGTPGFTLAVQHCRTQPIEYAILTVLSPRGLVCDEGQQIPEVSLEIDLGFWFVSCYLPCGPPDSWPRRFHCEWTGCRE